MAERPLPASLIWLGLLFALLVAAYAMRVPRDAWQSAESTGEWTLVGCTVQRRSFARHFFFVLHKSRYRGEGVLAWLRLCERAAQEAGR